MSNLKQKLTRIAIGCSVAAALFGGIKLVNYIQSIHSAESVVSQYQDILRQEEQIRQELGLTKEKREVYMTELAEMRTYGVRPTEKQILERAEMNMHGQTPSIEQRFLVRDYLNIDSGLKSKEDELRNEELQLVYRAKELELKFLESLKILGRK